MDLDRGSILDIGDNKKYILVKIFDVFYNEDINGFSRNYRIREITDKKIKHEFLDINSEQIKDVTPRESVRKTLSDLEYELQEDYLQDKDEDFSNNNLDIEDPTALLEDPTEFLDNEMNSINEGIQDSKQDIINDSIRYSINDSIRYSINDSIQEEESINSVEDSIQDNENMEDNEIESSEEFDFTDINNNFDILEEEELTERDIIFTENEQEEDMIEEIIRLYPEMNKGKVFKKIKFFTQLKNRFSESYLVDKNEENAERLINQKKVNLLFKTKYYKPLLNKYLNNDFSNNYLIPLVNSKLRKYDPEIVNEKIVSLSNEIKEELNTLEKIDEKFKDDKYLDYDTKQKEKEMLLQSRKPDNEFYGHILRVDKQVQVLEDTEDGLDTYRVLDSQKRLNDDDELITTIDSEKINNIGFVSIPKLKNNNLTNPYLNVFSIKHENLRDLYNENINNTEEIDLNYEYRYKKETKVKVCLPDNKEIIGTIKETKKGYIYLEPDDKTLINDKEILEFPVEDGEIKIDKVNDICDISLKCNKDNEKMKIYKFPDKKITSKVKENLLEQIIPNIRQILEIHKEELSKSISIGDINSILNDYELDYNDLEISNSKNLNKILKSNSNKYNSETKNNDNLKLKNNYKVEFEKKRKDNQNKDYKLFKNEDLEDNKDFYHEYLYNSFSFDSDVERLNWTTQQNDFGKLIALLKSNKNLNKEVSKQQKINKLNLYNKKQLKEEKINKIKIENKNYQEDLEKRNITDIDYIIKNEFDAEEIPEYTDITAFNDRGQRIEYGDVLAVDDEIEMPEPTNSDIYDSVANFLTISTHQNIRETDEDLINVRYVLNTLSNIMGLNTDIFKIENKCLSLYRDNYKTLNSFKKKLKDNKKKKSVEKLHQEYNQKNLIYITSAYMLIYLQITLKNLLVSPFEKCIPKLDGFPLDDEESKTYGIDFISCVLSNLKESQGIWSVLEKKETIKVNFKSTIKKLLNASIKLRLEQRKKELEEERLLLEEQNRTYVWNEFRPAFNNLGDNCNNALDLGDTDLNSKNSIKKSIKVLKNNRNLISMCIVDKINKIIDSQPLENILYDPLPLGNNCCLSNIDIEYNYLTFLNENDKDKTLKDLIDKSRIMDKFDDKVHDIKFYLTPNKLKPKLNTYVKEVYLSEEEIDRILSKGSSSDNEIIKNLYRNYLETGENGKKFYEKYKYLTISELSNLKDADIGSKADIMLLLNQIKENHQILEIEERNRDNTEEFYLRQQQMFDNLVDILDNEILLRNDFNLNLVKQIRNTENKIDEKEVMKYWKLLDNSISVNKDLLYTKLIKNVSDKNKTEIKSLINNLLNYNKINEEENTILDEDIIIKKKIHLENLSSKRKEQTVKKCIFNNLVKYCNLLSNIENKSRLNIENERLYEKKLVEEEQSFLLQFYTEKNQKYFIMISQILKNVKKLNKIKSYEDSFGCDIKIDSSVFNYEKSSKLLELNFYFIINYIIDMIDNYEDNIKSISGKKSNSKNLEDEYDEEDTGLDKKGMMIRHFIIDLLKKINKERIWFNNHTQNIVIKKIKTKNEESKDRNLHVMEKLNIEERRLRNLLTNAGLTKYENLASDYSELLQQEEIDDRLMKKYEEQHGSKPSDEQFQDFKIENEKNIREERQIQMDNMEFADAEGDDDDLYGM